MLNSIKRFNYVLFLYKSSGVSVGLLEVKQLANRGTDMVLLYNETLSFRESLWSSKEVAFTPPREILPKNI